MPAPARLAREWRHNSVALRPQPIEDEIDILDLEAQKDATAAETRLKDRRLFLKPALHEPDLHTGLAGPRKMHMAATVMDDLETQPNVEIT